MKLKEREKNFILAGGTLIGTIIGAGIFGLPYVFSRSGVLVALFYFLLLGGLVLLLNLFFGEIVLRTEKKHRLVGYAEKYLGKKAKIIETISIIFGASASLLVYIILMGNFLKIIFPGGLSSFHFALISWFVLCLFVYLGIESIISFETIMNIGLFAVFILVIVLSLFKIKTGNIILADKNYFFLPFGIFLFSLVGWNAVPEVEQILKKKRDLKKVITSAIGIVILFYFFFGLILSGVAGKETTKQVFQGLPLFLGKKIILFGGLFGFLAVATSFLVLANYLKNTLRFDYKFPYIAAFLFAAGVPLCFYLLGVREFLGIISFVGGFIGMIDGTIICLVYKKAKKEGNREPEYSLKIPNFLIYFLIAVLILGALSQVIYYF